MQGISAEVNAIGTNEIHAINITNICYVYHDHDAPEDSGVVVMNDGTKINISSGFNKLNARMKAEISSQFLMD